MSEPRSLSSSLQQIGRALLADDLAGLGDAELVGRFAQDRDEAAFTALVRRHGRVVLGVCRRVLRHEQDAEDAFQAVFLVLARNAGRVRRTAAIGNWLHGVAFNVARKARAVRRRRAVKEHEAAVREEIAQPDDMPDDLREILDGELHALPDKYRAPIVLCDLLGLTAQAAALEVGCPPKTLGTRLSRARILLARRLARRGFAVPAASLAAVLGASSVEALPPQLVHSAIGTAIGAEAQSAATVNLAVDALSRGVSNAMFLKTLKFAAGLACCAAILVGLAHGPLRSVLVASPATTTQIAGTRPAAPAGTSRTTLARHMNLTGHFFTHVLIQIGLGHAGSDPAAEDKKEKKKAPTGVWVRKEGEMKLDFSEKGAIAITPHGENKVIVINCEYTRDKDGVIKARIVGLDGTEKARKMIGEKLPVGTEFSFKWAVKDDVAALEDLKGEKIELFKSQLEGEFGKK